MNPNRHIFLTETPRDAMQAWPKLIAVEMKAKYINALLKVGFETVDCGSFVSAKAVPQMFDTAQVLNLLDLNDPISKLMVIVGNSRGGQMASSESKVNTIAYPHSMSGIFLKRNLNTTPENAWKTMVDLQNICDNAGKELRIYLTMAFGNPYGEACNDEQVYDEITRLHQAGMHNLVLSDTTGEGTPESIGRLCAEALKLFPDEQLGIHLHTKPGDWQDKLDAAWNAGIRRFEGALGGYGGCPMTGYELLSNLNTFDLVHWCKLMQIPSGIDEAALHEARQIAFEVFI